MNVSVDLRVYVDVCSINYDTLVSVTGIDDEHEVARFLKVVEMYAVTAAQHGQRRADVARRLVGADADQEAVDGQRVHVGDEVLGAGDIGECVETSDVLDVAGQRVDENGHLSR